MDCRHCGNEEVELAEPNKWDKYLPFVLPLVAYQCDACEKRFYWKTDPLFDRNRKIAAGVMGGLFLIFLVSLMFGSDEEPLEQLAEGQEQSQSADEAAETGPPLNPDGTPIKTYPNAQPMESLQVEEGQPPLTTTHPEPVDYDLNGLDVEVSQMVRDRYARNRAIQLGDKPPPSTTPKTNTSRPNSRTSSTSTGGTRISGIQLLPGPQQLQVMVQATGRIEKSKQFAIGNAKLVVDLLGNFDVNNQIKNTNPVTNNFVKTVRLGRHANYLRLVFDLSQETGATAKVTPTTQGATVVLTPK